MSFRRGHRQATTVRGESQGASLPSNVLRVATIRRPGKGYLREADVFLVEAPQLAKPAQAAYDTLFGAAYTLGKTRHDHKVALYCNGMSEATVGAVDGFEEAGVEVIVMAYDWRSGTYRAVKRRRGPASWAHQDERRRQETS